MTLTNDDVAHVAMLARLGLSDEEQARYGAQLAAILEHINRLSEVDTSTTPDTVGSTSASGLVNVWREDEAGESIPVDAAVGNAPDRAGDQFRVGAIQE